MTIRLTPVLLILASLLIAAAALLFPHHAAAQCCAGGPCGGCDVCAMFPSLCGGGYAQGYYEGTYYSEGYYQGSYYAQSYYQASYYAQSYYQGYYQSYYQSSYYAQSYYEGSYVSGPDLVASYTSPTSATVGTVTLTGRATNQGDTGTGSFTSYFQVNGDPTLTWTSPGISLGAGTGANVSASRTFSTPGTYLVRLCADGAGTVSESDEGNNCSSWTTVTIYGTPTATLTPAQSSITSGSSTSLTWASTNATSCASPDFATGGATSNLVGVSTGALSSTKTYGLTCTGPGGSGSANATVTVNACSDAGPVSVVPSLDRVKLGVPTSVTFTVNASNASAACTLTGPGVSQNFTPTSCNITNATYNTTVNLNQQTIYTLTCPGGQKAQAVINIIPKFQEF